MQRKQMEFAHTDTQREAVVVVDEDKGVEKDPVGRWRSSEPGQYNFPVAAEYEESTREPETPGLE